MDPQHAKAKRMLLIYFILCLVASFVHPVTPTFIKERGFPDFLNGALFSTMSLVSFVCSPFCGYISDRRGRKPILIASMLIYALAQYLFGRAATVAAALGARTLAGVASAGYAVPTLAYMVDVTAPEERGRWLAYYTALLSIGSSIGYFVGGVIGNRNIMISFNAQWISLLCLALLIVFILPESLSADKMAAAKGDRSAKKFYDFAAMGKILTPTLSLFFLAVTFSAFASKGYDNAFNFYIKDVFGFPPSYNGIIKAATGIIGLLANFTINLWIIRHFDLEKSLIALFGLCSVSLAAAPLMPNTGTFIAVCMLFYVFNSIFLPVQQALMAEIKGENYGLISGIFNAARMFGMFLGPLFMSYVYDIGHNLLFVAAAGGFALAALLTLLKRRSEARS